MRAQILATSFPKVSPESVVCSLENVHALHANFGDNPANKICMCLLIDMSLISIVGTHRKC